MSRTIRTAVVVALLTLALGAALIGAGMALGGTVSDPAAAQGTDPTDQTGKTITVSAGGEATAEPDEAVVRVTVEATADDPTVARRQVAENASSMRTALTDLGIPADAVRTTGYDIYQDRVRPPEGREKPATTYRARHSFAVEVDEPGRVGQVIDTAVGSGATGIHGVQFTLEDGTRDELRNQAIQEAMTAARSRADAMAAAGGLRVTGVQTAREGSTGGPRPVRYLETADGGAGGATSIESGPVSVRTTVTVTYTASG